jgi:ParB-like nuclease family protein
MVIQSVNHTSTSDNKIKLKSNPKYEIQTRPYTSSEYKRLKDSIKELGQEQPMIIDEDGYILDGYHRLKVCEELGIDPWVVVGNYKSEEQKIRAINQINWARRHFNQWELYLAAETKRAEFEAEVRVEQALKYQKGKKGTQPIDIKILTPIGLTGITGNNESIQQGNEKKDGRVNSKLGEIVGVTSTTIWQWKQVLDNANNEQLEALKL